jgi:hypothetical protein
VHHQALRNWIRQDQADQGERTDRPTTDTIEENRRRRQANLELLCLGVGSRPGTDLRLHLAKSFREQPFADQDVLSAR